MKARIEVWPNGIGCDVIRSGRYVSDVRNIGKKLRCFAHTTWDRAKVADFPLGTDPIKCVEITEQVGQQREAYNTTAINPPFIVPLD